MAATTPPLFNVSVSKNGNRERYWLALLKDWCKEYGRDTPKDYIIQAVSGDIDVRSLEVRSLERAWSGMLRAFQEARVGLQQGIDCNSRFTDEVVLKFCH